MNEHIKVLVVDDHRVLAQGLVEMLRLEGDIQVVGTAATAGEAIDAAREHAPDVVLMDYALPDLTGTDAARRIKDERPATKIVILTAVTDEAILVEAIEAGCSGYITKDKPVDEAISAVRAAHAGEVLISPSMLARLLPKLSRAPSPARADLTPRELEVLSMLAEGLSNHAIAEKLVLSLHTVRNHIQNILAKLDSHSKLEAVARAVREGIIKFG